MKARLILVLIAAVLFTACKDRDAEKKIAALEARINSLEGKKSPAASEPGKEVVTPEAEVKPDGPLPVMEIDQTEYDFGVINEGAKVSHVYKIKNTGVAPLIIQDAKPSCGCTAPDWTRTPIPPGGEGFVKAEFDSNGKPNAQNKTITVTANTWPKTTRLTFKAMVTPKAEAQNGPVRK